MEVITDSNRIIVNGNIKSVSDYQSIKSAVDSVISNHESIVIDIVDSLSFTSATIGYFNKIILKDKVDVHLNIGNLELYNLLDSLNLVIPFNIKKIEL